MAQLQKREKIMAGATGAFLMIFLANQFIFSDKNTKTPAPTPTPAAIGKSTQPRQLAKGVAPRPASPAAKMVRQPRKIQLASWGRDPFAQAFRLEAVDTTGLSATDFTLRGIIWKGDKARVLIGDEILSPGERTGDLTILSVQKDRVRCRKGRELVTLVLNEDEK